MSGPFTRWAQAGFQSELLPIIPPTGQLTPKSTLDLSDRGKTPGVLYQGGAWSGFPKWCREPAEWRERKDWRRTYRSPSGW